MGMCFDCPRIADPTETRRCCMDGAAMTFRFDASREQETFLAAREVDEMLLPIPGRRADRGEITHKKYADMNRAERRAFNSNKR